MTRPDPRGALEALASEHGLAILRFLRGRGWVLASQVAEGLGIHTTTAGKHLAAFHEAGFLERRDHPAKRPTHAYRLRSPVIRIEFNLGEPAEARDATAAAEAFLEALLDSARKVGGDRLTADLVRGIFHRPDWRQSLQDRMAAADDARTALDGLIADARRVCGVLVGATTTERLLHLAIESGFEGRRDLLPEVTP